MGTNKKVFYVNTRLASEPRHERNVHAIRLNEVDRSDRSICWADISCRIKCIVCIFSAISILSFTAIIAFAVLTALQKDQGEWSQWSSWSICSVTCDVGLQKRTRSRSNTFCSGESHDDRLCFLSACADGDWSDWGSWGSCSDSCSGGVRSRLRTCTNPKASLLGRNCDGSSEQVIPCNKQACPDQKVAFTVYGSSNETSYSVIKFPNEILNYGGGYNTSTGIFTCKIPGIYNFGVTVSKVGRNIDYISVFLGVNGVGKLRLYSDPVGNSDSGSYPLSVTGNFHLNVNDYVYVHGTPNDLYNSYRTSFSGVLIVPDN